MKKFTTYLLGALGLFLSQGAAAQANKFKTIAYYTGDAKTFAKFNVKQMDEVIYSFAHLQDGLFHIGTAKDSAALLYLTGLKKQNPNLKITISIGGWSGCAPCSEGFSTDERRQKFSQSVLATMRYFNADGIDLDWEYPTIQGFPGHLYQVADKDNFTALVKSLRETLGKKYIVSFAAGGFQNYLDSSINWKAVEPFVDKINIMTYDLVNGYSPVTGHHTPLYSTKPGEESVDNAVQYLLKAGIPAEKLVIGGAFYTRTWKNVSATNHGLYQKGEPTNGTNFPNYTKELTTNNGWQYYWDTKAEAPFWYNTSKKLFASGDDLKSIRLKAKYTQLHHLGGIMFWELLIDNYQNGMLQTIYNIKNRSQKKAH